MPEAGRLDARAVPGEGEKEIQGLLLKPPLHSTTPPVVKCKYAFKSKLRTPGNRGSKTKIQRKGLRGGELPMTQLLLALGLAGRLGVLGARE